MQSKKRTLPRGTDYNERAIALAQRLGIDIPAQPLTNAQFGLLWLEIGKVLLPFEQPEPATLQQLWAEIGMFLAEEKEPEFAWGRGRRPGSKARKPRELVEIVSADAKRKRRQREREQRQKQIPHVMDLFKIEW
jgi:hypothetical protein